MNSSGVLSGIPTGLRSPLLVEYEAIVQNFSQHRWLPSELSGGKFCEIVYTILMGFAKGAYPSGPSKPRDFVSSCRKLELESQLPRSFQILIPRLLPALYEVRNNRGVGHVGGDVNPNHMDAIFVLSNCNWIMAELVRVFHDVDISEAQKLVDKIVERRVPLVWDGNGVRRVLDPAIKLEHQILLLIATSPIDVRLEDLLVWTGYKNKSYFLRLLRDMHSKRLVELSADEGQVQILPPGDKIVESVAERSNNKISRS